MSTFVQGFSIGLSLIVAIGAQNAFILKQGLKKQYVFWLCLICALSDSVLMLVGVYSFQYLSQMDQPIVLVSQWLGAIFLFCYGLHSFYQSIYVTQNLTLDTTTHLSLLQAVMVCLAFTWLNPHVYLDSIILMGSLSLQFAPQQLIFALGAVCASWLFFFALGYGARLLIPLFSKAITWKILDALIGCVMWAIALSLIYP